MDLRELLGVAELVLTPENDKLPASFNLENQEGDNWCWAAVAISVSRYLNALPISSQCELAKLEVAGCQDCGNARKCDKVGNVVRALERENIVAKEIEGSPGAGTISHEISNDRPLIMKMSREPKTQLSLSHYVVVEGYRKAGRILIMKDPAKGLKRWEGRFKLGPLEDNCRSHILVEKPV